MWESLGSLKLKLRFYTFLIPFRKSNFSFWKCNHSQNRLQTTKNIKSFLCFVGFLYMEFVVRVEYSWSILQSLDIIFVSLLDKTCYYMFLSKFKLSKFGKFFGASGFRSLLATDIYHSRIGSERFWTSLSFMKMFYKLSVKEVLMICQF